MALINLKEVKDLAEKHLPKLALKHPGVQLLLRFIGKTVRAINNLDKRLKAVEKALNIQPPATLEEESDA